MINGFECPEKDGVLNLRKVGVAGNLPAARVRREKKKKRLYKTNI
jgi:hypothetical protein